jgi:predicted enzyme related to lactoylglutathione lyase
MNTSPEGAAGSGGDKGLVDYVEFPAPDLEAVKRFYAGVFGWSFEDYGPEYTSFHDGRLSGGFYQNEGRAAGGPLVVLRVQDLAEAERRVREAGGVITRPVFSFPGGSRFHFRDPGGNELAAWRPE